MRAERIPRRFPGPACLVPGALLFFVAIHLAGFPLAGCKSSAPTQEPKAAAPPAQKATGQDRVEALFKDDPASYQLFKSVQDDYRASRFEDAANKLEGLLEGAPDAPWAEIVRFQLAQALRVLGRSQQALTHLDRFLERYPNSPDVPSALLYKGEINLGMGKERKGSGGVNPMSRFYLDRALRIFEQVQKEFPQQRELAAQAALYAGSTYEELEESDEAASVFRRVAEEFTDTIYPPRSLFALAGVYLREGDVEAAERTFGEITDRYPGSSEATRAAARLEELGLVGYAAPPLDIQEWIGQPPPEVMELKGKATLISFWALWCPHCKQSIPKINDMVRAFGERGLNVVGVSRERERFEAEKIREYCRTNPMLFPTGVDHGARTSETYAVTSIPRVVVVDAGGKIRWHGHPDYLSGKVIERVLAQGAGS